jgi:hypothetical protein
VTQDADVEIVQAQPAAVVTVIVPAPPPGDAVTRSGATAKEHDALGSVTTKLLPAMVSVALLAAVVVFAAAAKLTVPNPVRFVPLEIVTHDALLVALHVQPADVVTVTKLLPPAAPNA